MSWYLIETMTQREKTVQRRIETLIRRHEIGGIKQVLVPTHEARVGTAEARRTAEKVAYPGYVFIEMELDDENWTAIRHVLDVKGFVADSDDGPDGPRPTPLGESDMARYLEPDGPSATDWGFSIGDMVRIMSGPMEDLIGEVSTLQDNGKAIIDVNVFGRSTPVDVDARQLAKA